MDVRFERGATDRIVIQLSDAARFRATTEAILDARSRATFRSSRALDVSSLGGGFRPFQYANPQAGTVVIEAELGEVASRERRGSRSSGRSSSPASSTPRRAVARDGGIARRVRTVTVEGHQGRSRGGRRHAGERTSSDRLVRRCRGGHADDARSASLPGPAHRSRPEGRRRPTTSRSSPTWSVNIVPPTT